jgi:hypothetical protein
VDGRGWPQLDKSIHGVKLIKMRFVQENGRVDGRGWDFEEFHQKFPKICVWQSWVLAVLGMVMVVLGMVLVVLGMVLVVLGMVLVVLGMVLVFLAMVLVVQGMS